MSSIENKIATLIVSEVAATAVADQLLPPYQSLPSEVRQDLDNALPMYNWCKSTVEMQVSRLLKGLS